MLPSNSSVMTIARAAAAEEVKPSFQVLDRTFAILDLFDQEQPEWGTTEVARRLGLPIPTVHRILWALRDHGYVTQHEQSKRFRLGIAALQLGDRAREVIDVRSVAVPALRRLAHTTGETALLTVLSPARDRAVCLERVETQQPLRLSIQPGRQVPLHAGASQKALLAYMRPEDADRIIAGPLARLCHATISSAGPLREELARIRGRGWASSHEETNVGVWGVAVPVVNDRSEAVCAVGIAGPSARLTSTVLREDVTQVHSAATTIAKALGVRVPPLSAPLANTTLSKRFPARNGRPA